MPDPTCAQCGHPLPPEGTFCTRCGAVFVRPAASTLTPAPAAVVAAVQQAAPAAAAASSGPESRRENAAATWVDARGPAHSPAKNSQATMFGFAAPRAGGVSGPTEAPAAAPPVAASPSPVVAASVASSPVALAGGMGALAGVSGATMIDPAPARGVASHKQTMIGFTSPIGAAQAAPVAAPAQPVPASHAPSPQLASAKGTMIGVAIPGIAPARAAVQTAQPAPQRVGSNTMLGVATPGIAPVHASAQRVAAAAAAPSPARGPSPARAQPKVLPMPAPLVDDEPAIGPAPRLARAGIPLAWVAGGVLALVVVFGVAVGVLWKGQSLVVVPRLDAQGHEELHLTCDGCPDGTTVDLETAHATFQNKEADLAMTTPLAVGDNPLSIRLTRPRMGRNEDVKVVVPIAFRIKADLASLSDVHPTVVVRVEAVAGSVVKIDGKPVTLDATGKGSYAVDVTAQTSGWSDDLRLIDQAIPYSIVPPPQGGRANVEQAGNLAVRAGIATLHLDAPGPTRVIETSSFKIAGRTVKGGNVTVNGQAVALESDGAFSRTYDAPAIGDTVVELRAAGPQLATRTAHFTVKRVARLADEARAREKAPALGFDDMLAGGDAALGKDVIVEGDVVQARTTSNQTVALVYDSRGCGKGPTGACLVRVIAAGDEPLAQGAHVRVFGKLTSILAPAGAPGSTATTPVPVVQADFVVKGHSGGR